MKVEIKVLVENVAARDDLRSEHGLAMLISTEKWKVLFDTGATVDVLRHNIHALNVDLSQIAGIVLSHGHYDHTGGLGLLDELHPGVRVFAHRDFLAWKGHAWKTKAIGCPWTAEDLAKWRAQIEPVDTPTEILPDLLLSGTIPGPPSPAMAGFTARLDGALQGDPFREEIFAVIESSSGPVLITGCCHRGLKNTIDYARQITRHDTFAGMIGGLHLNSVDNDELDRVADLMAQTITGSILVNHCTGQKAVKYLQNKLGNDKVRYFPAGQTHSF